MPKENKNDLRVIRTKSGIKSAVKELIMELDASKIIVRKSLKSDDKSQDILSALQLYRSAV